VGNLWVTVCYGDLIMTELTTAHSFMVRIYRIDPQDPSRLTGQIELLDGRQAAAVQRYQ